MAEGDDLEIQVEVRGLKGDDSLPRYPEVVWGRGTDYVSNEKGNNILDMIGRPFAAVKDVGVSLLFGESVERVEEVLGDVGKLKPLLDRHPEWHDLAGRMASLYNDITAKALENEPK